MCEEKVLRPTFYYEIMSDSITEISNKEGVDSKLLTVFPWFEPVWVALWLGEAKVGVKKSFGFGSQRV